jgi:hypothetical protein
MHLVIVVFMSDAKAEDPQIVVARIAAAAHVEAAKIAADASRRSAILQARAALVGAAFGGVAGFFGDLLSRTMGSATTTRAASPWRNPTETGMRGRLAPALIGAVFGAVRGVRRHRRENR